MFRFSLSRPRNFVRLGSGNRMTGRRTRLANTVKHGSLRLSLRLWWRTPSTHNSASTQIVSDQGVMLAPAETGCQTFLQPKRRARDGLSPLAPYFLNAARSYKGCLGFTAARSFREYPQRVSRFCATLLLELGNPIRNRFHHIARRFTSGRRLCFNDWTRFFALFNNLDCFLLWHC